MFRNSNNIKPQLWPLITISGIILFIIFYFVAASYYPGGSNFNKKESGFSWSTNYWCELLARNAKNGQKNIARPYGLAGMIILFVSVSLFWIKLPTIIPMKLFLKRTLQITGVMSMFCAIFIYSDYHDLFIYFSVIFGTIAFSIGIYGFKLNKYTLFSRMGAMCLLLIFVNNFIYLTDLFITYLPVIQKLTFALVFIWIFIISLNHYKSNHNVYGT